MFGNDISQVAAQAREFERSGKRDKFLEESANAVYDDGEGRQLFPVEIDPAMDRYLRQKGEGWQADAYRSWQRGKMLAADLRKGGDDPMKAEKERVLGEERAKVQEYVNERTRRGMPLFPDALAFKSAQEDEAEYARRKDKVDWHRSVFNGDLKKVPESVKKEFEAQFFPDNELGDELRARSLVLGWALDEGGYTENQVSARNGVPLLEQMAIRLKEQGEQIDFNKPGLTVYRFLSRRAQEDAHADELLKGAAESVRQAVLTGGDGRQALWEQRGQMGEDMYKKVGNTLRWVKADAERTRRGLEPVLPRVMEGLEWAVKYADGTANRIFQPEGMASIHQALKAMDGLTDAQMDALAEIVQRKGGNERSYMANVWKAGNRGWEDLGNGIRSLLRGGIAAQLDVAGGVKELFGGDGSALKADAKAADEYGRRLDAFLAMAQGTYRPINKPEYGWFGNGVLSAVRSVPITALSFSGVGAGVAAMSYAGDSYSKAVQERPDGGRLARLGGAAASGAVQGALDRAGAIVAKGVMGLRSGSAFVDKWMSKLSLSRQAMRLKSSALRAGARSGVAGGMVLGEEMTTEKLQDLADPVMQSLASVMAGEAPGIDWERFWKDFTNRDQNMELFGSVLAFALVGAGARFTAEAGMQRQLSREYGKLKRTFGFSDSLLARMRAEESDVARYAMMQDGIQDFMRRNYGQEVDGVKVGLGDRDGMRKLAARGGVRTMDVVAAAEAHAAETARGVDEVRVDGAEVQDGKGAVVDVKGPESGGVSEVGSGPVLSFEHGPVPERKGRRQADEKEAMREYVKAVNEQLKEFGASPIREEMNEFTEEMQYVVELGDRPEFYDTYDDAYEAVLRHLEEREDEVVAGLKSSLRQYRDKDEGYVGRVQDEANEEMMQHLSDVGQDGRMSFDRSKLSVPMTLAQLKTQGDFMRKSAEGRERIYAAQMGVEAGVDAARLRVYGANVAQEFANGRYEVVSRLYRGANPFDVYEEWTEGMTKVLIKDNEWTVAEFEDELKRLEGATGETFLATGEGVDRLQAVCEGVSKAARAHLMGHISDERLPDKLRRWFKMFALLFAKYFEFAQDVMLAKKMLGADVQGKMSEKFRRLLNDFAGFDEAAIAERARREEQAQIEAEAMGDVPEIGEWVAGRLPHPKTAAEAGSDLTGELQRIYDALTTTRTAKGRRRKDGTLGKSFEQRVVARAEQFFSREGRVSDVLEAANEAGFDFADSGELLSAVYDSVVYGYKRYAARGEGQEVSFSMGDRVRRVPMAEARRVADAFHRVEGMEPVAADVPAAYASDLKDALGDIRERYRVLQKETQEQGYALVMGDGKRVQVGGKGWREVKQHAADRRVLAALAVLPELAGRAEFIYSGENSDLKRKPNIARFHYYLTKADFKGASGDGSADLAYVNIAVAEGKNGELFYDLDASTVEDVDSMKGTSATLQRPRVPNTGEAGDGVPHKGRVALLKEFVNYVDRDLAGQGREGREVSVQDVEAQGGFDEHGVLAAENAVVVKPDGDVTMSVRALHASPHSFRKFDTAFMGKGEGNQAYGWGLYFATNPKVNRHYLDQFKTVLSPPTLRFRDMDSRDMNTWAKVFTDYFLADNSEWDPEIVRKEIASYFKPSHIHHFANQENLKRVSQNIVNNTNLVFPEESSRSDSVKIGLEFNQWLLDHLDEIEIRPGMSSSSNYKVELNVDDSVLLDWDRPFSEQSETVKEALAGELAQRVGCTKEVALESLLMEGRRFTGQQIYVGLCEGFARDWEKGMKKASLALRKFGIKGIRYADGYTRGKAEEEQTYNYVIFDGNDIKITAFADESTGGAWADYVDGSATFSIREKASIKKKAVADGTFMKAPNGANTNLTEDQWLSVRTEAFKNWFGDWEHDPENASKVVDENGEPRVVYHGTYGDFTVFDKAMIGSATDYGLWGRGFYFTNMENTPYGNKKLALFLNFRNPFIFNDYKSAEEIGDYLNIWDGNFHEDDRFGIFRPYATGAAQIADSAQERGHDGLIAVLGKWTEYIAFEPNQIKSSTNNRGTFDPKNPDITFSIVSAQEQGLFRDGHFEAGNAVITEPGVTFSITALHASPHSFRKFDTAFMGKGEGAQAYGWGLYFAENPEVNRSYMNQFAQDKTTWKFREVETGVIEVMQRSLVNSFLPKDALPEAKEDASDIAWSVLGDLVDASKGSMTVSDIAREVMEEIEINRKHAEEYPQEREKMVQLEGFLLSLLDHLDEIEVRTGMPSNYRVELNVEDYLDFMEGGELLFWDKGYGSSTTSRIGDWLLDEGKEEAYSLFNDKDPENGYWMGGKIYRSLEDALGSPREASEFLLRHGVRGIRYADGFSRWKAEEKQTYNYVIFDGNDIKITAFADESTGGAWADYEDPTASFSLATRESVWVTLEREAQKNRLEVLRSQTAKALETWRRVCAANDVKQGDGAEAFGRVMAVVASIYKTLPEGYRFGLYPYMRAAENLATRLEDGQAWLSDELKKETLMDDTSERMDAVIDKLLARTLEQADRYAVDQMRAEMVARIKAVQPTKKASGKFNKGKLSAEDYRHLHGIVAMMNTDQEAKEKRMLELEGVLSSNQSTEEERGAAELELKDWHTFGYLAGMGLEQTRACARALALFITTGRTAWSTRLDEERRRTKFKAEKIVEGLGQATPQGGRDAEEDAKASTRTKAAKYLKYGLQSYSQLLNGWKKIPALRGLAHAEVTAIAEANVALRNMKHARDREVTALVKRCFGVQRTKDVARVLSDFKKTGDSGVVLNPLVKVERTVRIAEAREWVGLSFEEREERRKAIRKEYNDRGLSDDKASVPEALIPEMRRQLAELDELVKAGDGRARRRKNITAKEEVVRPGRKGETLKVSRAQAMYAILLYEQAEYVETMRNEGIGEAEVARLREFVGAEGLAFGYGLRELMNRQGKLLARVYEEREGVPFPAVENYFRAVFRADHKLDTKASFGEQTNAVAGGAKYGMLIPRRKHNLHLAWNMDCEAVFQAASAEVENYICTADITARWRGILADKEAAASLKEHMGRHGIDSLRHWLDVIDGAGVMEGGALLAGAQATSRFQSAKAVALLAWNVLTMLKQTSGLMHGMFAGEVGMGSFLLHLGQTMSMTGRMGVFEVMKTEAFRARTNDAQAELVSQLMGYASDQNYTGAIRFSMAGMRAIEKMDVWSNAVSMAALYNAKWAELEEAGKRTGVPMTDDEMHALCMQSVTRALELVAQPLTQSQKSMLGASTGLFAKMACFMSSEVLNKVGMIVSHVSSGNWGQALALYGMMSVAEQTVIALWHALLDDEDEWEKNGGWFGAMLGAPVAMIGGVPMLGAAVEFGYKQATGQRIYAGTASGVIDYSAIYRAAKNTWKAVTGEKEMTFADWAELILLDAKAAAYVAGAGAGSRSKAADSVASWLLSVAGVANLSKPGFKLAE